MYLFVIIAMFACSIVAFAFKWKKKNAFLCFSAFIFISAIILIFYLIIIVKEIQAYRTKKVLFPRTNFLLDKIGTTHHQKQRNNP